MNRPFVSRVGKSSENSRELGTRLQHMGVDRSTFLIDADGVLRREWRKVKVPGHVDEALAAVRELRVSSPAG